MCMCLNMPFSLSQRGILCYLCETSKLDVLLLEFRGNAKNFFAVNFTTLFVCLFFSQVKNAQRKNEKWKNRNRNRNNEREMRANEIVK